MIKLNSKKLEKKVDERGFLIELLSGRDVDAKPFGQLILTTAKPGYTKGRHYHLRKREWYLVISGVGELLIKDRGNNETLRKKLSGGSMELVEIPIGFYHEITNVGEDTLNLITYTDEIFNPEDPDTYYEENS